MRKIRVMVSFFVLVLLMTMNIQAKETVKIGGATENGIETLAIDACCSSPHMATDVSYYSVVTDVQTPCPHHTVIRDDLGYRTYCFFDRTEYYKRTEVYCDNCGAVQFVNREMYHFTEAHFPETYYNN